MSLTERKTQDSQQKKVAVITGASKGIGQATAKLFNARGYEVYDFSRSGKDTEWSKHVYCDVTDGDSIQKATQQVLSFCERIDTVVCNAGYGISGAVEFTTEEEAKRQFEVNFFGAFSTAKAFLPTFRKQSYGNLIFVGSVAGTFPIPFQSFYSASKSAVISLASALRQEVKPFGIKVSVVLPGDTKTEFTNYREKSHDGSDVYTRMENSIKRMEKDERNGKSADSVAKVVYCQAVKKRSRVTITVGGSYKVLTFLKRILPETFVNNVVGKMYCKK